VAHETLGQYRQWVQQRRRGIGQQQRCAEQVGPGTGQFHFGNQPQAREQAQ